MRRWLKPIALLIIFCFTVTTFPVQAWATGSTDEEAVRAESLRNNEIVGPRTNYNVDQVDAFGNLFRNREEVINPSTGALNLTFTDLTLPGRGGMDVEIKRSYDSTEANLYKAETRVESSQYQVWVPEHYGWVYYPEGYYWFDEITEERWQDGYAWDHWHDGYYDYVWREGYWWDHWHEGYWWDHWHEGYWWDHWHEGYWWDHWHEGYWWDHWHEGYWWDHWHDGYWWAHFHEGYWTTVTRSWDHWHDGYWYEEWYWDPGCPCWFSHWYWQTGFWHTHYYDEWVWVDGYDHWHWEPGFYHPHWEPGYWHPHWQPGFWHPHWEPGFYHPHWEPGFWHPHWQPGFWHPHWEPGRYEPIWRPGYWHTHWEPGYWYEHVVLEEGYYWLDAHWAYELIPGHWAWQTEWYQVNHLNSATYLDRVNGIGAGWSFGFPVLEMAGGQIYYHNGEGNTMQVDWNSPSRFKDYQLLDVVFDNATNQFSNGQTSSRYVVTRKDGHKSYFASDGRLLGMQDRYGNTITFQHTTVGGVSRISKIIDTIGREINFTYTTNQVTITAPGDQVLVYNLTSTTAGKMVLSSAVDAAGRTTAFTHTNGNAPFNFFSKNSRSTNNIYAILTQVTYPGGGKVEYDYTRATGNLGSGGSREFYRVTARRDIIGGQTVNQATYAYSGVPDGYPTYSDPNNLPISYTYQTTVTRADGTQLINLYNHQGLEVRGETVYPDGKRQILETEYDSRKTPVQTTTTHTAPGGGSISVVAQMSFDQYRNLLSVTDPQGALTTYTYDPTFHQVTSVTKQQNSSGAQARTEFTINAATGNADAQRQVLVENGVDRSIWTYFTYDAYGNVTQARVQMEDGSFRSTNYEYDPEYGSTYVTRQVETYTDEHGVDRQSVTAYAYNLATGRLTTYTDPLGGVTTRTYDLAGRPLTDTFPSVGGVAVQRSYSYDDVNLVSSFTDENGRLATYHYDQLGRMVRVRRALSGVTHTVRELTYDTAGRLVAESDVGRTMGYAYDGAGRVTQATYPDGTVGTTAYDDIGRTKTETDALGNVVISRFDVMGRAVEVQTRANRNDPAFDRTLFTYDYMGNTLSVTDPLGSVTSYQYDALGRLVRTTDALGNQFQTAWDNMGNRKATTGPDGRQFQYGYDPSGRLLTMTDPLGGVTRYAYDAKGRRIAQTDPRGEVTRFEFDALDRLLRVTDSLGGTVVHTYDRAGNRTSSTDQRGKTTHLGYDEWNRLIRLTDPLGAVTEFAYDLAGNQISRTDALGNRTSFTYDAMNRLLTVTDPLNVVSATYVYDAVGNRIRATDANGGVTSFTYDGLSRLVSKSDPLAITEQIVYDAIGNVIQSIDGKGQVTTFTYDQLNRLATVTDAAGSVWRYTHDVYGNVTKIVDPLGRTMREDSFDQLNRKISSRDALGTTTAWQYDPVGNRISEQVQHSGTGASSGLRSFTYDALNRQTRITAPGGLDIRYEYDAAGNRTAMIDALGTTTYTYDAANRLLTRTEPDGKMIRYEYSLLGQVTRITDYAGAVTDYAYDATGRMTTVTRGGATASFAYDPSGNRTGMTLPNGVTTSYSYDAANRLTNLVNRSGGGTDLSRYSYTYDAAHNVTSVGMASGTTTYTYDSLNRLVEATAPGNQSTTWSYDQVGNRTAMTNQSGTTAYTYDTANRLTRVDAPGRKDNYTWDVNGNQLSDGQRQYQYDGLNRLLEVIADSVQVSYQYNGDGMLALRTEGANTTRFYMSGPHVINEGDGSGAITASMFHGLGFNLGRAEGAGAMAFFLFNGRGDVTGMTGAGGAVAATWEYDPFGNLTAQTGTSGNSYLFAAEYHDPAAGLYYLRARFYSPQTGRFVSQDSYLGRASDPMSLNLYTYVKNNPLAYVDPSGYAPERIVVFVHGRKGSDGTFSDMVTWLVAHGGGTYFDAGVATWDKDDNLRLDHLALSEGTGTGLLTVKFPSSTARLEKQTKLLAGLLDHLYTTYGTPVFDLVGHSAGGLISRNYLQDSEGYAKRQGDFKVERLVTLSSPHKGAGLAFVPLIPMDLDLRKSSKFIKGLRDGVLPPEVKVMFLTGDRDWLVSVDSGLATGAVKRSEKPADEWQVNTFNPIVTGVYRADHSAMLFEGIGTPAIYNHELVRDSVLRFLNWDQETTFGFRATPEEVQPANPNYLKHINGCGAQC